MDIVLLGKSTAIMVGERGSIFKTLDGGSWGSWTGEAALTIEDLIAIDVVDATHVVAVGMQGKILKGTIKVAPERIRTIADQTIPEDFSSYVIANLDTIFSDVDTPNLIFATEADAKISASLVGSELHLSAVPDSFGTANVIVSATDDNPATVSDTIVLTINSLNDAPVLADLPDISFTEDGSTQLWMNQYVTDVDHDTTEISFTANVTNAAPYSASVRIIRGLSGNIIMNVGEGDLVISIDTGTNVATFAATTDSSGEFTVVFTATDDSSAADTDTMMVTVSPHNDAPVVVLPIADKSILEDSQNNLLVADLNPIFQDIDSPALSYIASAGISLAVSISNDSLFATPAADFYGDVEVVVTATDGGLASVSDAFIVSVESINDPPVLSSLPDISFPEDSSASLRLNPYVTDVDHDTTAISFAAEVVGSSVLVASVDAGTHIVTFTPSADSSGQFTVVLAATDDSAATNTDTLSVVVTPVNDAPSTFTLFAPSNNTNITISSANLQDSLVFRWQAAQDVDGDSLRYGMELTGFLGVAITDMSIADTQYVVYNTEIVDHMQAAGQVSIAGTWTVYATDGTDTTRAFTEPALLIIGLGLLDLTPPAAPKNLIAEVGDGQVTLTWNPNTESDFLRYRVYGGTTPATIQLVDSTSLITDTTRTIANLTNGTTYYYAVTAVDGALNESDFSNEVSATPAVVSITNRNLGIPDEFALHPNYPNPFNPQTTVQFDLPEATTVTLFVFDLLGREVVRLEDGHKEPGYHQVAWDAKDHGGRSVPSGIYIARLATPEYTKSIKMLLLK